MPDMGNFTGPGWPDCIIPHNAAAQSAADEARAALAEHCTLPRDTHRVKKPKLACSTLRLCFGTQTRRVEAVHSTPVPLIRVALNQSGSLSRVHSGECKRSGCSKETRGP